MKKLNFNLGGEQSGHIILGKFATTGDGLMVALEVLFSLRKGKLCFEKETKKKKRHSDETYAGRPRLKCRLSTSMHKSVLLCVIDMLLTTQP